MRTPWEVDDGVTRLQEDVLMILEDTGIPTHVNDQIMKLIAEAEREAERIKCVAIRYPDIGVFTLPRPARHHHVMWTRLMIDGQRTTGEAEQGFLTTEGRFVGREEAFEIATRQDQIIEKYGSAGLLFSEDMWDTPAEAAKFGITGDDDTEDLREARKKAAAPGVHYDEAYRILDAAIARFAGGVTGD